MPNSELEPPGMMAAPIGDRADPLAEARALLLASPLFADVPPEEIEATCLRLRPVAFAPGDEIVRARELGDRCFFIQTGQAEVLSDDLIDVPTRMTIVGPGDIIGEIALLKNVLRIATVRAITPIAAFVLDRDSFLLLANRVPTFSRRLRERADLAERMNFLRRASPFGRLPSEVAAEVVPTLRDVQVQAGETVIRQGEPGDCLFLIRSGRVEVRRDGRRIRDLSAGDYFGEMALLSADPRNATVRACEDSIFLALRRPEFDRLVQEYPVLQAHVFEMAWIRSGAVDPPESNPSLTVPIEFVLPTERVAFWLTLVVGLGLFIALSNLARGSSTPFLVEAVLVVGALVGPATYVVYLGTTNVLTRQPRELGITFVLSAVGVYLAAEAEIAIGAMATSSAFLSSFAYASIEEVVKVFAVVWLLRRPEARFQMDGVIYGAAAGMGFSAFETLLYGTHNLSAVPGLVDDLWLRALLSPFTHGTWTAIICARIWLAKGSGPPRWDWRVLVAFGASIALHTAWDWSPPYYRYYYYLAIGAIGLAILAALVSRARKDQLRSTLALNPELIDARAPRRRPRVICPHCLREVPPGAHYCPRDGTAVRA